MVFAIKEATDVNKLELIFDEILEKDVKDMDSSHEEYTKMMQEFRKSQEHLETVINSSSKKLQELKKSIKNFKKTNKIEEDNIKLTKMSNKIDKIIEKQQEYRNGLPKKSSWFLTKCIGPMDISLYWKKYNYKNEYETLKMNATVFGMIFWFLNILFLKHKIFDTLFIGYILWYYSSLTLQEHILVANGSRIKLWWRVHHYISILAAGIVMTWPDSVSFRTFRPFFNGYVVVQALIHVTQFYYQKRILYRLRTLGVSSNMALTVDGFTSSMWNGLAFMTLFLSMCYIFQMWLSLFLLKIYRDPSCAEYHALLLSMIYMIVSLGNIFSLAMVVVGKILQEKRKKKSKND